MSRFAIRRVRTGPPELRTQLPVTGRAVARRADPNGVRDFVYAVLDTPVKYRIPPRFSPDRYRSQDLDRDEQGDFVWISAVAFRAHATRENPYTGMRDFAVDLSYVVDPTVEGDATLDVQKVAPVAVVEIDDDYSTSRGVGVRNGSDPAFAAPAVPACAAPAVPAETFRHELEVIVAALATLAGESVTDVVIPAQIDSTDLAEGRAAYVLGEDGLRYHGWDPMGAEWAWRSTADPDELTYWIVDDIASSLAWDWAQEQPRFAAMDEEQRVDQLWMPRWQFLMIALRPAWGDRTSTAIGALTQGDSGPRWEEIFADARPVEPPAPEKDVPWGAGASKGPPPETFMRDDRSRRPSRKVLLGAAVAVLLGAALVVVFRDTGGDTVTDMTPAATSTPAESTGTPSRSAAPSSEPEALTSNAEPTLTPTEAPPQPPPPPGEAQQITPPAPAPTWRPTWRPTNSQDDEDTDTSWQRPPPTRFTPPVQADPWIGGD